MIKTNKQLLLQIASDNLISFNTKQLRPFFRFIPTLRLQLNRILVEDRKQGSGDYHKTCYIVFQKLAELLYK